MLAALLITLREGLEAALIVGVVLGVLRQLGMPKYKRSVWSGVVAALVVSIVAAMVLSAIGIAFEGRGEEIFEGIAMVLAAVVLTWMIFWMQRQGREVQDDLESDVRRASATGNRWALFSLAFVAVVREGIETVLFLTATAFSTSPVQTLVGGALGLVIAITLGWMLFAMGRQLNVKAFFRATGVLLLLFAAGLLAYGVHELQEAALLPVFIEHVWDINPILNDKGTVGLFLSALFGYNGNPSLLEVVAYVLYLVVVGMLSLRPKGQKVSPAFSAG